MPAIARVENDKHPKYHCWTLLIRSSNDKAFVKFLDGMGKNDVEGSVIPLSDLGQQYNCAESKLDKINDCFHSFPVLVYGKKTSTNPMGEFEINSHMSPVVDAKAYSPLKNDAGSKVSPFPPKSSDHYGNFGSGNDHWDSKDTGSIVVSATPQVKVVKPPPKIVKITKLTQPTTAGINIATTEGCPITSVDQIEQYIEALPVSQSIMIWGPAGVGKSAGIYQYAQNNGKKMYEWRLSMMDPTLMNGIGIANHATKRTEFFPLDMIPDGPNCVLFLDEITTAPPSVQALAYQITLDHRIGSVQLPPDCRVIAAGNRTTDRGVAYMMPSPLANRLFHLTVNAELTSWRKWAMSAGVDPRIVTFLSQHPEYLHKMEAVNCGSAWPSPRSWVACDKVLKSNLSGNAMGVGLAANVGTVAAKAFIKFCNDYEKTALKNLENILNGFAKNYIESDPSKAITVAVAVVANVIDDDGVIQNAMEWANKQNDEYKEIVRRGLEGRFGSERMSDIPAYSGISEDDSISPLPF